MIQHLRHRLLHSFKRLVPAVERLLPQELPQTLNHVAVRGIGRQGDQMKLRMPCQPLLDYGLLVILRAIDIQNELLGFRMNSIEQTQQVYELLPVNVAAGQPEVQILLVIGAVGPQDVQALASRTNTNQETLPDQQPAAEHQVHPPNGMTRIDIIAPCEWCVFTFRFTLVTPDLLDEGPLFVRVPFPEKGRHFVIASPNAMQEVLDAGGRIRHGEGVREPLLNLLRTAEMPLGNRLLELLDLTWRQVAWVPFVAQDAEGGQALVAKDPQPFGQLPHADAQQGGDFLPLSAIGNPQPRRQSRIDAFVEILPTPFLDLGTLLLVEYNWFHRPTCGYATQRTSPEPFLLSIVVGSSRSATVYIPTPARLI